MVQKRVLYVSVPAVLYASGEDAWFYFQGSLLHVEMFSHGERAILRHMPPHEDEARENINDHVIFAIE